MTAGLGSTGPQRSRCPGRSRDPRIPRFTAGAEACDTLTLHVSHFYNAHRILCNAHSVVYNAAYSNSVANTASA